jgi:hypothetical protein
MIEKNLSIFIWQFSEAQHVGDLLFTELPDEYFLLINFLYSYNFKKSRTSIYIHFRLSK